MEQNIIVHDLIGTGLIAGSIPDNLQSPNGGWQNSNRDFHSMEHFIIEQTRVAHDALGDAYNTALVCSRLDLLSGWTNTRRPPKCCRSKIANRKILGGILLTLWITALIPAFPHVIRLLRQRPSVRLSARMRETPQCCRWINQGDKRYMAHCSCAKDGEFLMRIKFRSRRMIHGPSTA